MNESTMLLDSFQEAFYFAGINDSNSGLAPAMYGYFKYYFKTHSYQEYLVTICYLCMEMK